MSAAAVEPGAKVRLALPLRRWKPAPFRRGPSPFNFAAAEARALGQRRRSASLFDHPFMSLSLHAGTTLLAAIGTAKLEGVWQVLAWAILIGAGSQTMVDGIRFFGGAPSPTYPEGG